MPAQPPLPMVCSLVVCREIYQEIYNGEYTLVAPTSAFGVPEFPCSASFRIYADLCGIHKVCWPELCLIDSDGGEIWHFRPPEPMTAADPLTHVRMKGNAAVLIPQPGRYDLLLMASGKELARYPLKFGRIETPDD